MKNCIVNVLGTDYRLEYRDPENDKTLEDNDGYCDPTTKLMVVIGKYRDPEETTNVGDLESYQKKVARHEIIHAFHLESGIHESFSFRSDGFPESITDWFAVQGPKIYEVWKEAGAL